MSSRKEPARSTQHTSDMSARGLINQSGYHSSAWQALGLFASMGPVPPHAVDWSILMSVPWIWVVVYLADNVLFFCAVESSYRYLRFRRISLFWPLFWSSVSLLLLWILLSATRFGSVGVGPELLGLVIIQVALVVLRATVLADWQPWHARRFSEDGDESSARKSIADTHPNPGQRL